MHLRQYLGKMALPTTCVNQILQYYRSSEIPTVPGDKYNTSNYEKGPFCVIIQSFNLFMNRGEYVFD